MELKFEIKEITVQTAMEIWRSHLWQNSPHPVKPLSSMLFMGGYDLSIYENAIPKYWAIVDGADKIIGVNSAFESSPGQFRSRGLWVHSDFRKQGIGASLLVQAIEHAKQQGAQLIWSFPRQDSLSTYENVGFIKCSDWVTEGTSFGPNCYAVIRLSGQPIDS